MAAPHFPLAGRARRRRPTEPAIRALRVAVAYHQQQIAILEQQRPLDYGLGDLFAAATTTERETLARLLGTRRSTPRALVAALSKLGGREDGVPDTGSTRRRRSYPAMVRRVAHSAGASEPAGMIETEARIIAAAFGRLVDSLTPATMAQLAQAQSALLQSLAPDQQGKTSAATFASIARASGLDIYLMASSVIAAIGSALGLHEAAEPSESQRGRSLQAGLARLGWVVLAQWQVREQDISGAAMEAPAVMFVATLRRRLERERRQRLQQHRLSLQRDMRSLQQQIDTP